MADADPGTGLRPVHGEQVVARLGQGLGRTGRLAPEAIERALAAVGRYREQARAHGAARILIVATAAVRQAENRASLLERLATGGVEVRVATGEDEARLTLLGVLSGLPAAAGRTALVDIGGGSTEIVVADGARAAALVSVPVGVVALAERFLHADPIDPAEYRACADHAAERLAAAAWPVVRPLAPRRLAGTAGTITTLAALDLGLAAYDGARVQGHRLTRARVEALLARLCALTVAERARLPAVEPGRADLIVPGIALTLAVLDGLGLPELTVSDAGLREGILLDAVGWTPPEPLC